MDVRVREATAPVLKTKVPGPRSLELVQEQRLFESSAISYPRSLPIALKSGLGSTLIDADGNVLLDFLAGAGAVSLGHSFSPVIQAVVEQMGQLLQTLDFPTEQRLALDKRLLRTLPEGMRDDMSVLYCGPTGADAVEAAFKAATKYTGRTKILAFEGSYHGMTSTTAVASAMNREVPALQSGEAVVFAPIPGLPVSPESTETYTLEQCQNELSRLFEVHGAQLAAAIIEPVLGEGGSIVAPSALLQQLRSLCAEHDALLICDEIQCGVGKTGAWWGFAESDIQPDLITISKGITGSGLPLSLLLLNRDIDCFVKGDHVGTFRGFMGGIAAANATIDYIESNGVLAGARERGVLLQQGLAAIVERSPSAWRVTGTHLIAGIDLLDASGVPSAEFTARVQRRCLSLGLITERGGRYGGTIRMLPPLNTPMESIVAALDILELAIGDVRVGWTSEHL